MGDVGADVGIDGVGGDEPEAVIGAVGAPDDDDDDDDGTGGVWLDGVDTGSGRSATAAADGRTVAARVVDAGVGGVTATGTAVDAALG
jgi:hypothetical protein